MKNYFFILVIAFFNLNCKSQEINNKSEINVNLLNDSIHIPNVKNGFCVDTLFFKIENYTNNDFVFYFVDSLFYFNFNYNERKYKMDSLYNSPYDGINLRFLDKNYQSIETEIYNYFIYDENHGFEEIKYDNFIISLNSNSELILKAILRFPNYHDNVFHNEVLYPEKVKYIKIVFETVPELTRSWIKSSNLKFRKNIQFLKVKEIFIKPVSFNCK